MSNYGSFNNIVTGVLGSLIAAGLLGAGFWLMNNRVPAEIALNYTATEVRVGTLSTWYLSLRNNSHVAFQEVRLQAPGKPLLRVSFDPIGGEAAIPSSTSGDSGTAWEGKLNRGGELRALFVFENTNVVLSDQLVTSLISAKSLQRNEITGDLNLVPVPIRRGEPAPTIYRTAIQVVWFLLPISIPGVVLVIAAVLRRRRSPAES